MPQEIRREDRRTEQPFTEAIRVIEICSRVNNQMPYILQEWAVNTIWPGITQEEKYLVVESWPYIQQMMLELQKPSN